ncbi:ADP-ribosyl cyclase/cyclic ADP-ribose hydrolase [Nematostella vectensis]|uniref:ADP-ribosyl cyclase/cyclic ADP-ribose hydrolase n=1 Tax=Nematostella vectensis TaxID=45351 RepID=UPI002076D6D4|nr:ADP-ribosyl cyclase/cyclic ADP-ribose hydrolase [Nematostella vectensis]
MRFLLSSAVLLVLVAVHLYSISSSGTRNTGTTRNFKDIVLGRCYYYKEFMLDDVYRSSVNCSSVWLALYDAFAFKDPCSLTFQDYEPYFAAVVEGHLLDKSLFWSGTMKLVHSYASYIDLLYTTLEDTMAGWLVNGLTWCGNVTLPRNASDGIDYVSCPTNCDYFAAFWGLASRKFAERTRGVARVMVNGSRVDTNGSWVPAYRKNSFFGKYELPNLQSHFVTELRIIVMHTIGTSVNHIESCGNGSVKTLVEDATRHGLNVSCSDDPSEVKHLLCVDHPTAPECLFATKKEQQGGVWKYVGIIFIILTSLLLLATVLLLMLCVRHRQSRPVA